MVWAAMESTAAAACETRLSWTDGVRLLRAVDGRWLGLEFGEFDLL